jgi:hypothetical protein
MKATDTHYAQLSEHIYYASNSGAVQSTLAAFGNIPHHCGAAEDELRREVRVRIIKCHTAQRLTVRGHCLTATVLLTTVNRELGQGGGG